MDSSMSFSMFSPLRTPDVIKAKKYKFSSPRKIISDEESVTSDMTKDLRKMAMNVSSKLKRAPDITPTSSDNELFQSQSKLKKKTSNKTPNKTVQDTGSGSESGILDSSSESDSDNKVHKPKSSPYSSSGSDSDKETRKQNSSPQKKVNKNSQNSGSDNESSVLDSSSDSDNDHINRQPKSSPKIKVKKNLLNSDSERSGLNSNSDSERHSIKQKHKSPVKQKEIKSKSSPQMKKVDKNSRSDSESSVLDSSLDSDSDHKTPKPPVKQNKSKRKSAVCFQGSLLDDNSDADDFSDRTVETKSSEKSFRENESESQPVTKRSHDSSDSSDSDQGATPAKKSKVQDSPKKTTNSNSAKKTPRDSVPLSYKIPDNFTIDKSEQYLTKSDVKGKQLWLIVAPGDFDISTLDKQKINLDGDSIMTSQIDDIDRQYEVYAKLYPENYSSSYNCVTAKSEGSEAFVVDAEMQGQIRIMNWIPSMPVVKLVNTPPTKHTVPDHLKPCWQPFGSEVPVRQDEELRVDQKQKKKKKKKDKKKH